MASIFETTDAPSYAYLPFEGGPYTLESGDIFFGSIGGELSPSDVDYIGPGSTDRFDEIYLTGEIGRTYQIEVSSTDPLITFEIFDPTTADLPQEVSIGTPLTFTFGLTGQLIFTAFFGLGAYAVTFVDITPEPTGPTAGNDSLFGTDGKDNINLLGGDDWFDGGDDHDTIVGGDGNDTILGGAGKDSIVSGNGSDFLYGGSGNDTIQSDGGNDYIDGEDGNDVITGGTGRDTIYGGGGRDNIQSGSGRDFIDGGTGNDVIHGGSGADTITGGAGNDLMTGGSEADTFVFATASGSDTITDFTDGLDRLDVSGWGITDLSGMTLAQQGTAVLIGFSPYDRVLLENTDIADLDSSDFTFAAIDVLV